MATVIILILNHHHYVETLNISVRVEAQKSSDWKLFYDGLFRNKLVVTKLILCLEEDSDVDFTQTFKDAGKKFITYDIIANDSFISWKGIVLSARLYTHPFVKRNMENDIVPQKHWC